MRTESKEEFDQRWRLKFEALAGTETEPYVQAAYGSSLGFARRQRLIHHSTHDVLELLSWGGVRAPACLDIGCNTGLFTRSLVQVGLRVFGMDYAMAQLQRARASNPEIPFLQGDAYRLPFADATFDCVVSLGVLPCVGDWRRALDEVVRLLKPGGVGMVETNRAFPIAERLVRSLLYLARRQMSPAGVAEFFRSYAAHRDKGLPADGSPLKFEVGPIVELLTSGGAACVNVHDPVRHGLFHGYTWAVTFVAKGSGSGRNAAKVARCSQCLAAGP